MAIAARVAIGAAAGAAATIPMTAVMAALQRLGWMRAKQPPAQMTERVVGPEHEGPPGRHGMGPLASVAHLGFGAASGAAFAALRRDPERPQVGSAVAYALGIWAASYAGWAPALDLMPRPTDDAPGRPSTMVLAHVVYGVALAGLLAFGCRALGAKPEHRP